MRSRQIILCLSLIILFSSCSIFRRNSGIGCPTGKAIGAEKLLEGDKKAQKGKKSSKN